MGNCLLTKLKGVVDNDNLPLFNTLKLEHVYFSSGSSFEGLAIISTTGCRIYVDGDGVMAKTIQDVETSATKEFYIDANVNTTVYFNNPTDSYNIFITEKSSLTKFENISNDATLGRIAGNLSQFKYLDNLNILRLAYTKLKGNLKDLPKGNFEKLTLMGSSDITGDVKEVACNPSLTLCNIFSNTGNQIIGTVEDFVVTQISVGRTTCNQGDLRVRLMLKYLTFGGVIRLSTDTNCFPSWSSASKIAVYVTNETGQKYNYNNVTTIYAKGATQEEIASWENDGKTVVEVE